jgi:hypothetical protein
LTQLEKLLGKSFSFKTNLGNDSNTFNATPHNDTFDNLCVNHCNDLPIKKNNFLFEHQPLNILCGFTIYVMLMKGYVFKFKRHYLHNHGDLKSYWKTPTYQTSQLHVDLVSHFDRIWFHGNIFSYRTKSIIWNMVPPSYFLPCNM